MPSTLVARCAATVEAVTSVAGVAEVESVVEGLPILMASRDLVLGWIPKRRKDSAIYVPGLECLA